MIYTDLSSELSSNNSAVSVVTVLSSALVAHASPSSSRVSLTQDAVVLSAAGSYDPDEPDGSNELTYNWTCSRRSLASNVMSSCFTGVNYAVVTDQSELDFVLTGMEDLDQAELTFTVIVSRDVRQASAQSILTFAVTEVPAVTLLASSLSLDLHGKHNPHDQLIFSASVEGYSMDRLAFAWTTSDAAMDLTSLSPELLLTDLVSPNLVLGASCLLPGVSISITVTVTLLDHDDVEPGQASITVLTNSPPSSGTCSLDLASDPLALNELRCEDWTDDADDFPIWYQFGYLDPMSTFLALTSPQTSPSASVLLPVGELDLQVLITDNKQAQAVFSLSVVVPSLQLDTEAEWQEVSDSLLGSAQDALAVSDLNTFAQLATVTLSLLNSSSSLVASSSTGSTFLTFGPQVRESVFNLTRRMLEEDQTPRQDTLELAVALVADTCRSSEQLTTDVRTGALDLLVTATHSLTTAFGSIQLSQADQSVYVLSQVLTSFLNQDDATSMSSSSLSDSSAADMVFFLNSHLIPFCLVLSLIF